MHMINTTSLSHSTESTCSSHTDLSILVDSDEPTSSLSSSLPSDLPISVSDVDKRDIVINGPIHTPHQSLPSVQAYDLAIFIY